MNSNPQDEKVSISYKPNVIMQVIRSILVERTLHKLPKNTDILDLCCGYGVYFLINPNAFGIEGDPACSTYIKRRFNKQIPLVNLNKNLPFANNSFSIVISHDVFEHFYKEQLVQIFSELNRVLKPNGRVILIVPNLKGYNYGVKIGIGHKTYITNQEINQLIPGLFRIHDQYSEPLPRFIGKYFTHNKEVFILSRI